MEGIQNKKRCRKIDSAGDKKDLGDEVKSNEEAANEIVQDSQSPRQKRRRTILSQKVEDNVIANTSKNKGISKQLAVKISVNDNQHTKISDRSFQNENKDVAAQSKYIVKVPKKDMKERQPGLKHGEGNGDCVAEQQIGRRKRKNHINHPRSNVKATNSTDNIYNPHKPSPFNLLSDEMIVKIFEYIPRQTLVNGCVLTCRRLKNICYDEALWKRVDLGGKKIGPGQAGKIILRGTRVLRMSKTTILSPLFPKNIERKGSCKTSLHDNSSILDQSDMRLKLTYLDLSSATIDEKCLETLFEKCWYLKKVSLENCKLNESILNYLSQNTRLEVLHLAMAQGVTSEGLAHLSQNLRNTLVEINLSWIGMNDDMIEEALLLLGNNSKTLTHLNIAGCRESLTDDRLNFILGKYNIGRYKFSWGFKN